ncbi:MAG: TIGR02587 family membrane protein [Stenomitos rutilans HA7619-LM2]|jgi:putative integral membrane protein (TIGR02587 family)|nr:TIGR02587 family membrane protein [Stenomitos rutilans HA7619-LM2]
MVLAKKRHQSAWATELNDLVRGACGGFLFGIPLLYTMEVWWVGSMAEAPRIVMAIVGTFIGVFWLNRTEGFRRTRRSRPYEAFTDTVEAMTIGLVCSASVLLLLRELTFDAPLRESLGKVIFESVPFALGVALAGQFLGDTRAAEPQTLDSSSPSKAEAASPLNATLADIGATLIGAIVIGFNISPTDEIPMLAAAVSAPWLLGIMAASLLISYGIVFEAGFSDQRKRRQQQGIFQRPLSETVMSYLVSLVAAVMMLWFFQRLTLSDPWTMWLEQTLLLGLPTTIGGAAGRLAV